MVEIRKYHLEPTELVPNSARPLLHYKNVLPRDPKTGECSPASIWEMFEKRGWRVAWLVRYGPTQLSHYHSKTHETMAVCSGTATIRFGVADTSEDMDENTYGGAWEAGGVELQAEAGDVFVIPAGVAHKTHKPNPPGELKLLSPGSGHGIEAEDPKKALSEIVLSGFTMMGAYNGGDWDFITEGGNYERVWSIPKPRYDPVFGDSDQGLVKLWRGSGRDAGHITVRL